MRERVFQEHGLRLQSHAPGPTAPAARTVIEHALIYGSPATVAEKLAAVDAIGVGGVIMSFRLGPMSYDVAANSLTLFAEKVMPKLRNIFPEFADDGRFWCKPLANRAVPGVLQAESELGSPVGAER